MSVARNFLLKPTDSLLVAFQRVSANGEGFAAVVDENRKWLATFEDVDGRAAMLRGVSLDEPVSSVAKRRGKRHFVVENGEVVDVVKRERPPVDGVVMAGGKGTRLRAVTGNAGALALLPNKGAEHVFITNADLITGVDYARLFDFHRSHDALITMAAARFVTTLKYGVVHTRRGVLQGMDEKPELEFLCNAGMYMVDRAALKYVPKNTFFQMPDLIEKVRAAGNEVRVFPLWEKWVDAGSPEEFQQVLIEFATGVES